MEIKNARLIILCCSLIAFSSAVYAQQRTSGGGGQATGTGGTVSYSIGLIDYNTLTGKGGQASQGLQQAYDIKVVSGIQETGISLTAIVYPNPLADVVNLKITSDKMDLTYQLLDIQGRLLLTDKIKNTETRIAMSAFVDNTYFIKILTGTSELKTFKIIKTQ